jgi:pilus assembly protein Flp/PilA
MILYTLFLTKYYLAKLGVSPEEGQGLVEYAIILLLVALVVIGALRSLGVELRIFFETILDEIPSA